MFKSRYTESFKKECSTKLSCPNIRRAILLRYNGTTPVNQMVNADGTVRSIDEMCSAAEKAMYKRHNKYTGEDDLLSFEESVQYLMEEEESDNSLIITKSQKAALDRLCETEVVKSVVDFRKAVMDAKELQVCAIHFFHWDGTCRDVRSIYKALQIYPCSYLKRTLMRAAVGGAAVLAVGAAVHRRRKSAPPNPSPNPDDEESNWMSGHSYYKTPRRVRSSARGPSKRIR